jgi:predicted ATP-grasp superfamily ATP-dependent carboligase
MDRQSDSGVIIIEGHVQGLANTRALGRENIPVVVVDKDNCIARYSKYCKGFFRCPDYRTDDFAAFLIELAQKEGLKGWSLIPSNDHAVYTISRHKSSLLAYFRIISPDLEIIDKIYDKLSLIELASIVEVPVPFTHCFVSQYDAMPENLQFPLLTKGRNGLSFYKEMGKKAFLANDENTFRLQISEINQKTSLKNTFTQELIPFDGTNKTISLAAFCIDGEIKTYWMGVKLREHPLQFGTATFTESIHEEDCLIYSKRLLKALNYTGVCEVEYLKDPRDQQFKLIEINARTWLWVGHAIACGINFPLYIYNYLNQIQSLYPSEYPLHVKWRNPFSDTIYSLAALIKGKLCFAEYSKQSSGEVVNALWDKDDKRPYFTYGWLMFNFLRNR